jgi:hypothetical protein
VLDQLLGDVQRYSAARSVSRVQTRAWALAATHPLVEVIAAELHSRVGNNADTVGAIASHKTPPTFLLPHLHQSFAY